MIYIAVYCITFNTKTCLLGLLLRQLPEDCKARIHIEHPELVAVHGMIQRPAVAIYATVWQACVYDSGQCIRRSVSLPRKVSCDTRGRCLTACQHRELVSSVRPLHS